MNKQTYNAPGFIFLQKFCKVILELMLSIAGVFPSRGSNRISSRWRSFLPPFLFTWLSRYIVSANKREILAGLCNDIRRSFIKLKIGQKGRMIFRPQNVLMVSVN